MYLIITKHEDLFMQRLLGIHKGVDSSQLEGNKTKEVEQSAPTKTADFSTPELLTTAGFNDSYIPKLTLKVSRSPNPDAQDCVLVESIVELTEVKESKTPPHIVFVLDRSQSMWDERHIQMKKGLKEIIHNKLPPNTQIQIITFDDSAKILWTGDPAETPNIDEIIDGIDMGGNTNLSAGFDLIDPDFFKDGPNLICTLTDGESNEGELDNSKILENAKQKFKNQPFPSSFAIAVSAKSKVYKTEKLDFPVRRGFYAKSNDEIVDQFVEISEEIGKVRFPVKITYHTDFGTHEKDLGSIRSDKKLRGAIHLSKGELELLLSTTCQLTIDGKNFDFKWIIPNLSELSFDEEMIELYYTKLLREKSKELVIQRIRPVLNHLGWLKSKDPDFDTHYGELLVLVNYAYNNYILNKKINNECHSASSHYDYAISTGQKSYKSKNTKIDSSRLEYKGLSLDIFNEDFVKLVKEQTRSSWKLQLKPKTVEIHLDPTDYLLKELADESNVKETTDDMYKLIDYVNKKFPTEVELSQSSESLTNYIARGTGNTLLKAILCAYLISVNISKNNLTEGSVKIYHGIDDALKTIHFWCIYQTKMNTILFDPTNIDQYCLVDLTSEARRKDLISYYEEQRKLPGILRDTMSMLGLSHPERQVVRLPEGLYTKNKEIPEELRCLTNSNNIITEPVRIEKTNLIIDHIIDLPTLREAKDQSTLYKVNLSKLDEAKKGTLIPDSDKLRAIKRFVSQHKYDLGKSFNLSSSPELTQEEEKQSIVETSSTMSLPSSSISTTASRFRLFAESKPSSSFYLCQTPDHQLEMIFTDEKARMDFLKKPLGNDGCIIKQEGFKNSIFIRFGVIHDLRPNYIHFDSKENLDSFIELFGVKGQSKGDNIILYDIANKDKDEESSILFYLDKPKWLFFGTHHRVFGKTIDKNIFTPKDYYLEVADKSTNLLTRDEYVQQIQPTKGSDNIRMLQK